MKKLIALTKAFLAPKKAEEKVESQTIVTTATTRSPVGKMFTGGVHDARKTY